MKKSNLKTRLKVILFILKILSRTIFKKKKLIKRNDIKNNKNEIIDEFNSHQYFVISSSLSFWLDVITINNEKRIRKDIDLIDFLILVMLYDRRN